MAIVYKYTSPSGKSYIGQTSTDKQNREGKNGLYYKQCTAFYNAILKYGLENFQYEILEKDLSLEEAKELEKFYINFYKTYLPENGYNISRGGEGRLLYDYNQIILDWNSGLSVSELISKYQCNNKTICKILNFYGIEKGERTGRANEKKKEKRNEEIFRKWNRGFTVEQLSKEYNLCSETIGKILSKKGISGIDRIKRSAGKYHTKKIYQFSKEKEYIGSYNSIQEAEKITGISHSNIIAVCNGRRKTAGGFIWKYELDVPRLIPME